MLQIILSPKDIERFWSKVDRSGGPESCWPWTAGCFDFGYGKFRLGPKNVLAHRVSWDLINGPIPNGLWVLHNCPSGDNPSCVNPAHLFLGTHLDNTRDMHAKGRARPLYGSACSQAKLTEADVLAIREALARGELQESLADRFGISRSNVGLIGQHKTWTHVGGAEYHNPGKLTASDVREIRRRAAAGELQIALAAEYGVAQPHISAIVLRKTWRHVSDEEAA